MQEQLLQEMGPQLPFPHTSGVESSRHSQMRELRIQSHGDPLRVFYAFDPSLSFILEKGSTLEATVTWGDYLAPADEDELKIWSRTPRRHRPSTVSPSDWRPRCWDLRHLDHRRRVARLLWCGQLPAGTHGAPEIPWCTRQMVAG